MWDLLNFGFPYRVARVWLASTVYSFYGSFWGILIDFGFLLLKFDTPIFDTFVWFSIAEFFSSALKHQTLRVIITTQCYFWSYSLNFIRHNRVQDRLAPHRLSARFFKWYIYYPTLTQLIFHYDLERVSRLFIIKNPKFYRHWLCWAREFSKPLSLLTIRFFRFNWVVDLKFSKRLIICHLSFLFLFSLPFYVFCESLHLLFRTYKANR